MSRRVSGRLVLAFASAFVALGAANASAATRFIAPAGNDNVPVGNQCTNSLQPCKTIARGNLVALAGDTIQLAAGTYPEKATITKAVSVVGAGQAATIIGVAAVGTAFISNSGPANTVSVSNLTVTLGNQTGFWGGGVLGFTGTTNLTDVTVTNNTALLGAGIAAYSGATVNGLRVTATSNTATNPTSGATFGGGGGLFVGGTATFTDSTFNLNKATGANSVGGTILTQKIAAADTPTLTLNTTTVTNSQAVFGAGLGTNAGSTVHVQNSSTIANNTGGSIGGGVATFGGTVNLTNANVNNNTAPGGGGLAIFAGTTLNANGANIVGNSSTLAGSGGGGAFVAGTATLTNTAVSNNTSNAGNSFGGGIWAGKLGANDTPNVTIDGGGVLSNSGFRGGGIAGTVGSTVTVKSGAQLNGNTAAFAGGGLYTAGTAAITTGATFNSNIGPFGGGTFVDAGGTANISNGQYLFNRANGGFGGAIGSSGVLTVTDSALTDNSAGPVGNPNTGGGGGISVAGATPAQITRTFFVGNKALNGGGIFTSNNTSIIDSNFQGNSAGAANPAAGGAIHATGAASITLNGSALNGNSAFAGGGVAVLTGAKLQATGGTFDANSAGFIGGAAEIIGDATFDGTDFVNNTSGFVGGAVWAGGTAAGDTPEVTLTNVDVDGSTAVGGAGVAVQTLGALTMTGGSITDSTATTASGLYIQEGASGSVTGADITGNDASNGNGGGISNSGTLSVTETEIADNTVAGTGSLGLGAGIYSLSSSAPAGVNLTVRRSTVAENTATGGSAIVGTNKTTIDTSTIADNEATGQFGAVLVNGTVLMRSSTVHGNTAAAGGVGGLVRTGGTQVLAGNIVSGNTPADCNAGFSDGGYNNGPASCGFSAANNDQLAPAQLNALTDNGGPTRTKAPQASSPSIERIPANAASLQNDPVTGNPFTLCGAETDQRGVARPQGALCDMGSVEIQVSAPELTGPDHATFVTGTADSVAFSATGVPTPSISVTGTLPSGVTLTDNGDGTATLGGTAAPGTAGTYNLTITAANRVEPDDTISFELLVIEPLAISTTVLPGGVAGTPYNASLAAVGGVTPYAWSLDSGSLPAGLTLNANGTITGTPTGAAGTSTFTVRVTDSADNEGNTRSVTKELSIVIGKTPTVLTAEPALIKLNLPNLTVTLTNIAATLKTAGGTPIAGQTITFKAGTTNLCSAVTNANGRAACSGVTLSASLPVLLNLGYDANFAGTASLAPATAHANLIGG